MDEGQFRVELINQLREMNRNLEALSTPRKPLWDHERSCDHVLREIMRPIPTGYEGPWWKFW